MPRGTTYDRSITPAPRMTAAQRKANAARKEPVAPKKAPATKVTVSEARPAYASVSPAPKTRPKAPAATPSTRASVTVPKPRVKSSVNIPKPTLSGAASGAATAAKTAATSSRSAAASNTGRSGSSTTTRRSATSDEPVGFERTKGGDYPIYRRNSAPAKSFREAFANARKEGLSVFEWKAADGVTRRYNTELAPSKPKK